MSPPCDELVLPVFTIIGSNGKMVGDFAQNIHYLKIIHRYWKNRDDKGHRHFSQKSCGLNLHRKIPHDGVGASAIFDPNAGESKSTN